VLLAKGSDDDRFYEVGFFSSAITGHGEVVLTKGLIFDLNTEYEYQVVLNKGSDFEISSDIVPIRIASLSFEVDLNQDGIPDNSQAKGTAPGLTIGINIDDDDQDGVPDMNDKVIADVNGLPMTDDDLIAVRLIGQPASQSQGIAAMVVVQGGDKIKVWLDQEKKQVLLDPSAGIIQKTWVLGSDIATLGELPATVYIEGLKLSAVRDDVAILTLTYTFPAGKVIETDRLVITVPVLAITPDYNRDGVIDMTDRNQVTEKKPWRFWINDDNDNASDPVTGLGGDDLPGSNDDLNDYYFDPFNPPEIVPVISRVNGIRDLVDFFPLYLDLKNALTVFPPQSGYSYVLKQADAAVSIVEANVADAVLTVDKAKNYLEDLDVSAKYKDAATRIVNDIGITLSAGFLQSIKGSRGRSRSRGRS
jgi:hypothetical protein